MMFVGNYHGLSALSTLVNDLLDLSVDCCLNLLAVWLGVLNVRKSHIAELSIHSKLSH